MVPASFEYLRPGTLSEAVSLLSERGEEAKILSGGQSLIPMLKLRLATPTVLVDINRIPGLDYVEERDGALQRLRQQRNEKRYPHVQADAVAGGSAEEGQNDHQQHRHGLRP